MIRRRTTLVASTVILLAAGGYSAGCGGSGDNDPSDTATFLGDVATVTGSSGCTAPGDGRLLFCVDELFCTTVDPSLCDFRVVADIEDGGPVGAVLHFVDDVNEDGEPDDTEDDSVVTESLQFCTGDEVEIADAVINFTSGTTTATVRKTFDNCAPTPTPTPTTVPPTSTPGTPSPTQPVATATATATATVTPTPTS